MTPGGWARLSLAHQFLAAASIVVGAVMLIMGIWVSSEIERGVVRNAAAATALNVDSWIAPLLQGFAGGGSLSPEVKARLDAVFSGTPLGERVRAIVVWLPNGRIAYSNHNKLIGTTSSISPQQRQAWAGEVTAEYSVHTGTQNELGLQLIGPMLEIYAPVRSDTTREILAVAEFYEDSAGLSSELRNSRWKSWLLVAGTTLGMIGALFGIVQRGSRTIDAQRQALEARVGELSDLVARNQELSRSVARAHQRTAESNDQLLRRIGSDLHDGPAQLMEHALLRLHLWRQQLRDSGVAEPAEGGHADVVERAIADCLKEIRSLSAGLSLPDLARLSLAECLQRVADLHEERTDTRVRCDIDALPETVPVAIKACLFRFAQEGLNNAFRHAAGLDQSLGAFVHRDRLIVTVSDRGPGLPVEATPTERTPLGLAGLRNRIESLGGHFETQSEPGRGTRLTARFSIANMVESNV